MWGEPGNKASCGWREPRNEVHCAWREPENEASLHNECALLSLSLHVSVKRILAHFHKYC